MVHFSWNVHPLSDIVWSIDIKNIIVKKILSKARFLAVLILICFRTTNSFRAFWEDSRFNRFKFIVNFLILVSSDALILIRDGWFFITVKSILVKKVPIFLKFDWLKWAPFLDGDLLGVSLDLNYFLLLLMLCKFSQQQLLAYSLEISCQHFDNLTVFLNLRFLVKKKVFYTLGIGDI